MRRLILSLLTLTSCSSPYITMKQQGIITHIERVTDSTGLVHFKPVGKPEPLNVRDSKKGDSITMLFKGKMGKLFCV